LQHCNFDTPIRQDDSKTMNCDLRCFRGPSRANVGSEANRASAPQGNEAGHEAGHEGMYGGVLCGGARGGVAAGHPGPGADAGEEAVRLDYRSPLPGPFDLPFRNNPYGW
jgi:hypothetical protein